MKTAAWIKMMWRSDRDSATEYDLRGDVALTRTDAGLPTMNFGYWRHVAADDEDALWAANLAMFELVATTGALGPRDANVLDAGCGFGTNAIYLANTRGCRRVVGLNVSTVQLATCRELAARSTVSDRLAFCAGSATAMPFADASFDKVVSVEAAFHFAPRSRFFEETFRVLQPGGTLAMVDLVAPPPRRRVERVEIATLCRALQIPRENVQSVDDYRRELEDAGLSVVELRSIREHVLPCYRRWLARQPVRKLLSPGMALLASTAPFFLYPWDYICVEAVRT